jgi:glycosyltransferase involved in cell wall biosynthesis
VSAPASTPRRLRVVFLDHVARFSGGEIALLRLLPTLAREVDVQVLLGEEGPLVEEMAAVGLAVEVVALPVRLREVRKDTVRPGKLRLREVAPLPGYVFRLAGRLRELAPDIVHTNSLKAALYGGAAGRLAGVPVVWHIRDRISDDYLPASAVRLVRLAGRVLPSAVVANSQTTLETLPHVRWSGVVPNPVVPDTVEDWSSRRRDRSSALTFGISGRLAPWKGQLLFLEAFAAAFRGTEARAHVVGAAMFGEDEYSACLQRRATELGIGEQVEFRGFRADIWKEFAELDVLVHSSVIPEPFGQVVLEGMAAGLPVVAPNAGGPAELITDGVDGLLVAPGEVEALATALKRLHDDPALRDRLGEAARVTASAFTPERAARQLVENYRTLLANR